MPLAEGTVQQVFLKEMPEPDNYGKTHRESVKINDVWYSLGSTDKPTMGQIWTKNGVIAEGAEVEFQYVVSGDFKNGKKSTVMVHKAGKNNYQPKQSSTPVSHSPGGISGTGSPNPAAVGQVLNFLVETVGLDGVEDMSDQELVSAIQQVNRLKDRMTKLWNVSEVEVDAVQDNKTKTPVDDGFGDIPF